MPKKSLLNKEQIVLAGINLLRKGGNLNARDLSKELNSSTQPIYNTFKNMEEIKVAVLDKAKEIMYGSLSGSSSNYFIDSLFSYIMFAKNESGLFKFIYFENPASFSAKETQFIDTCIRHIAELGNYSQETAKSFYNHAWLYAHGIACNIATGFASYDQIQIVNFLNSEKTALINYFKGK